MDPVHLSHMRGIPLAKFRLLPALCGQGSSNPTELLGQGGQAYVGLGFKHADDFLAHLQLRLTIAARWGGMSLEWTTTALG